jgi:hypothetical protein
MLIFTSQVGSDTSDSYRLSKRSTADQPFCSDDLGQSVIAADRTRSMQFIEEVQVVGDKMRLHVWHHTYASKREDQKSF